MSGSYKFGMSEWTDSADSVHEKENDANDFQPPKKRLKLPAPKGKQCVFEMVSPEDLEKGLYQKIPRNTKWALSAFKQWNASRNERSTDEPIDIDILSKPVDLE